MACTYHLISNMDCSSAKVCWNNLRWVGLDWVLGWIGYWVGLGTGLVSGRAWLREVAKSWALLGASFGEQLDRPLVTRCVWQDPAAGSSKMIKFTPLPPHLQRLFPCFVVLTIAEVVNPDRMCNGIVGAKSALSSSSQTHPKHSLRLKRDPPH